MATNKEEEREYEKKRLKQAKQELMDNLLVKFEKKETLGGQHCGIPIIPVIVRSEELGVEIKIDHFRSNYQNRDFAILLMELAIDGLIR